MSATLPAPVGASAPASLPATVSRLDRLLALAVEFRRELREADAAHRAAGEDALAYRCAAEAARTGAFMAFLDCERLTRSKEIADAG